MKEWRRGGKNCCWGIKCPKGHITDIQSTRKLSEIRFFERTNKTFIPLGYNPVRVFVIEEREIRLCGTMDGK